ncbi:MAG: saccharopine dehydrogenase NADP-binding domain-containing protein [Acidimicrobiales bacterium]|nr:saccharopine dehydrogenase NADP-binding domain-containing protein [Acidimicrobiales bacterium]
MPDLDVVLFGPTGVTGREVARYLGRRAPSLGLRWGVAGRDRDRIDAVLADVGASPDEVLLADVNEPTSIEAMASAARVVANLVGPYAQFGEPVYAACAAAGTHQLDLTGEVDWVKAMIGRYDEEATDSGAKIVPTAGYEALPFDLATLLAAQSLHERTLDPVVEVDIAVSITSGVQVSSAADLVSGGTFTSGVAGMRRGLGDSATDAYYLDPPTSRARGRYDLRPRKHPVTGQWVSPMFPTPFLNPPVIHRSAALLRDSDDGIFAADFRYREGSVADTSIPSQAQPVAAVVLSLLTAGMGSSTKLPPGVREPLADKLLQVGPKAGEGPRPDDLDDWSYRLDVRATDVRGATQDVVVEADGHPGYKSTATMIGEAACALADTMSGVPDGAGFLTPATALGLASIDRMAEAGVRFHVLS